jgi:hypothetical protein
MIMMQWLHHDMYVGFAGETQKESGYKCGSSFRRWKNGKMDNVFRLHVRKLGL